MASGRRGLSRRRTIGRCLVALVLGGATVACGGVDTSSPPPSLAEPDPPPTADGPAVPPTSGATDPAATEGAPVADATLDSTAPQPADRPAEDETGSEQGEHMSIYFAVEGGYAALTRSITIGEDGAATKEISGRSSSLQLGTDQVAAIVEHLDDSGLFNRDRTYPADGADLQRYEIRYRGATIVAHDTSVPPPLTEAIQLLEAALRS